LLQRLQQLHPFQTPDTRRLATLFAVVYFAQGMWTLPVQTLTVVLKDRGLSSAAVADFFLISTVPWLIKPAYGLLSDLVPLFGSRRKSYFLLSSGLASVAGFALALGSEPSYWRLALLYTAMGFGLAFNDVLTDAVMVESGKPRGLTGAFQAVQWAAISVATLAVGVVGGHLAELRALRTAFLIGVGFPLVSLLMARRFLWEAPARFDADAVASTWASVREAATRRDLWIVAAFIFCYDFTPSAGPAFLYYQMDVLHLSQRFIGALASLQAATGIVGAMIYAPLSRRMPLKRLIVVSIGLGVVATLAYLLYRGPATAIAIDAAWGAAGMIVQLSILDLAAKACPRKAEGTYFALFASVLNGSAQLSTNVGGRLYDSLGFMPLVLISAALTAAAWLLVPLVNIDRIEAAARRDEATVAANA
jgi:MFS family permease